MMAIANAERRLAQMDTTLTIRSPSDLVNRLLGMMEMAEMSRLLDRVAAENEHVEKHEAKALPLMGAPSGQGGPSEDFRRVTAMPSDPDVIDGRSD